MDDDFTVYCGVHIFTFIEEDPVSKMSNIGDTFSPAMCACFCQILQCPPHIIDEESPRGCLGFLLGGTLMYDVRARATESGFLSRAPVILPTHVQSSWVTKHV